MQNIAVKFAVNQRTVYRWLATWYDHRVLKLPVSTAPFLCFLRHLSDRTLILPQKMGRGKKMSPAAQEVLVRELDLCPKMLWDEVQWIVWARTGENYSLSLVRKVAGEHGFQIVVGSTQSKHIDRYPPPFRHSRDPRVPHTKAHAERPAAGAAEDASVGHAARPGHRGALP